MANEIVLSRNKHVDIMRGIGILFFVLLATQFNIQSNIMGNIMPPFYSFYGMAILGSLIVFCISFLIDNLNIIAGGEFFFRKEQFDNHVYS